MKYKPGKLNIVADALSRRSDHEDTAFNSAVEVDVIKGSLDSSLREQLIAAQSTDKLCQRIVKGRLSTIDMKLKLFVQDGMVYKDRRLVVPTNSRLKTQDSNLTALSR